MSKESWAINPSQWTIYIRLQLLLLHFFVQYSNPIFSVSHFLPIKVLQKSILENIRIIILQIIDIQSKVGFWSMQAATGILNRFLLLFSPKLIFSFHTPDSTYKSKLLSSSCSLARCGRAFSPVEAIITRPSAVPHSECDQAFHPRTPIFLYSSHILLLLELCLHILE